MMVSIPARPFDFELNSSKCALIIIDMQRDFVLPGGFGESLGNDVSPCAAIVPIIGKLLSVFRTAELTVVHTREAHKPDLSDCPKSKLERGKPKLKIGDDGPMGRVLICGELGTEIVPDLAPVAGELVIDKPGKGAFFATDLHSKLQEHGIEQLIFAGVTTEVCVQTTMREANDRGYDCLLITDATESYFPEFKEATINMITAQGAIVGWACDSGPLMEAIT